MSDTNTNKLLSHFYVKLDGSDAPPELMSSLENIAVESSLHLPDITTLVIHDPRLKWIDDAKIAPGVTLTIEAKAGNKTQKIFDGEIVELEPIFGQDTQRLHVRAFDRLHRLTRGRRVRSFVNVTDGDVIKKVAQEVGLQSKVGPTSQVHPYVFQSNETNLEFLQRRAAALGYLLYVDEQTLCCEAPKQEGAAEVKWGESLFEFRPRMSTVSQINTVTARGWDPDKRQEIVGQAQQDKDASPHVWEGKNGGQVAQQAFRIDAQELVADRPIRTQALADVLAKAVANQHAGRFVEADGVCAGNPAITAGVSLKIASVGTRFSGTYHVTSATHTYNNDDGYVTEFTVSGLNMGTLLDTLVPEPQAVPTQGLVIGVVTDNQDPENLGRVKVKYPWLSPDHASYWARVVSVGGGPKRGIEFLPEINDEVLVGFELGDIHYPYVLGGLWNGTDKPPKPTKEAISGAVNKRTIVSRTGLEITLDDTSGAENILIQDFKGNKILIDTAQNNITVLSQGNIEVQATGNIDVKASGNMSLEASGTVDIKGATINLN